MGRTFGHFLGYAVGAVIMVAIGVAVLSRIPPLWAIINPHPAG